MTEHYTMTGAGDLQRTTSDGTPIRTVDEMHPEVQRYLRYFQFGHLPPHLAEVSRPFCDMAHDLAARFTGPQLTVTLRSLLQAKDDAVRCALDERAEQVRYRPLRSGDPLHTANEAQAFIKGHDSTRGE